MKVVLFCGGMGTRLRDYSDDLPKPLVPIGSRPILWHVMRYYAHFGHKDFILALGYRGEMIREYFLKYNECLSNDFVLSEGGKKIELMSRDLDNWRITFVDTGLHSNLGQRLLRVKQYVKDDEEFLANYSDGLGDIDLATQIADFRRMRATVSFAAVPSPESFHVVHGDDNGIVTSFGPMRGSNFWVNAGFFCLRQDVYDYIEEGDEFVVKPFERMIQKRKLAVHRHEGFWQCMDTFKDKVAFDRMAGRGECPWMLWQDD